MPTQYEKLRDTLLRHTHKNQQVSTRDIRGWFALDWGASQKIFPAHFAIEPEGHQNDRQPLIQQAQEQPLLARCYGRDGQAIRSAYTVLVDGSLSQAPPPQQAYDLLYQILEEHQGTTKSLKDLKAIVSDYLDEHGLERPGLLDNVHRYTPDGGYPNCLNGRHLLVPAGKRGHYTVQLPPPEKARMDLIGPLKELYQREGLGLFEPLLFKSLLNSHQPDILKSHELELNVIHKLSHVQLGLPEILAAGLLNDPKQNMALLKLIHKHIQVNPEHLRLALQQMRLILEYKEDYLRKMMSELLEHFLNPLHPAFENSWERLYIVYLSLQPQKAEVEKYFHEEVPAAFRQMAPKALFHKALEWFLGGKKGVHSRNLTKSMHARKAALAAWPCPGTAFWEQLPEPPVSTAPPSEWLVPWAKACLTVLLSVPGLNKASDDHYSANYLACGILSVLFPDYVFAVSPPSLEGLQELARRKMGNLKLGALQQDEQASDEVGWMASVIEQVYQLILGLRQLRPGSENWGHTDKTWATHWITPRRLDMLLYLIRNDPGRQITVLNALKEVSDNDDAE